jgi:hypothetical protein
MRSRFCRQQKSYLTPPKLSGGTLINFHAQLNLTQAAQEPHAVSRVKARAPYRLRNGAANGATINSRGHSIRFPPFSSSPQASCSPTPYKYRPLFQTMHSQSCQNTTALLTKSHDEALYDALSACSCDSRISLHGDVSSGVRRDIAAQVRPAGPAPVRSGHLGEGAVRCVLRQAQGAEAVPVQVPQQSLPEQVHQLAGRREGCGRMSSQGKGTSLLVGPVMSCIVGGYCGCWY